MKHLLVLIITVLIPTLLWGETQRPNIVLVMADDQGWGQTSYNGHPTLKTPNIDTMARAGISFNRFYAAAPVCSPTRASVLTGRTPARTGVPQHGRNLCLQEKTLPQALKKAGYKTALFGKWHLNGVRGHGVPILGDDRNHPGRYGFDEWLSVSNFFDIDPLMSRNGKFEEFKGDSSEVVVSEALKFMKKEKKAPFLAVIWYGSPHSPWQSSEEDQKGHTEKGSNHFGELVALDRSIGTLRKGLRNLGIEKNTIVWYCSDNGGLKIDPVSCGSLRGYKGEIYEGGLRVPGIIEWPGRIKPAVTGFPASTMDIMPTIVDLLGLPADSLLEVHDGESLKPLFSGKNPERKKPIPFVYGHKTALIDGDYKLLNNGAKKAGYELYNLKTDAAESKDLSKEQPDRFTKMKAQMEAVSASVLASAAGKDYPEKKVLQKSRSVFWTSMKEYKPHFDTLFSRPEYEKWEKKVPAHLRN